MQYREQPGNLRRPAHLVTFCFACFGLLLLNLPEVGRSAAIMVKQAIDLHANNMTTDSYDSSDPTKSVNGQWSASVSGDAGDVLCINGITNSFPPPFGTANIYGRAYIALGSSVDIGTNGFIGTHAWALANTGVEAGHLVPNTNFAFPIISLPDYSAFVTPVPGTVVTTNSGVLVTNSYDDVISGGNYVSVNSLGSTIVTGPSTLVLPKGYSIGNLTIAEGASLSLYVGGKSMLISGNGVLNQPGLPSALVIYCTSDLTNISFSGNAQFIGVLIAPNANAAFNGADTHVDDIFGAIILNSLTLNGNFNFHFDEALIPQGIVPPSPSLAASLAAPTMSESGQFQFNVSGVPGFSYTIEASTDLTDWQPVFTNTSPFTFTDTNATPAQNFYRAVYYQQ